MDLEENVFNGFVDLWRYIEKMPRTNRLYKKIRQYPECAMERLEERTLMDELVSQSSYWIRVIHPRDR